MADSFWDTETSGTSVGFHLNASAPGTITNVYGKTTSQMQTLSTFTSAGWDFIGETVNGTEDIWRMLVGGSPILTWQNTVIMPNVVGLMQIDALNILTQTMLTDITIVEIYHPTIPEGQVIEQSPAAGEEIEEHIWIILTVSIGPNPYDGGSGTETDPFQIGTAEQLDLLGQRPVDWGLYFVLTADIDMASYTYGRAVIGHDGTDFSGQFYGNGHVITNLTVDGMYYCGLFGTIANGGSVTGVGLENVWISGTANYIGGLAGSNYGNVANSYSTGSVSGELRYVGGLVGRNYGSVSNSYSTGLVSGDRYVGGLLGVSSGSTSNSYSTGTASGDEYVGGLCGYVSEASISNSFWDTETSGMTTGYHQSSSYPGTITNVEGKATVEMQTLETFTDAGWDFVFEDVNGTEDLWRMPIYFGSTGYPHCSWEDVKSADFVGPFGVGLGDMAMISSLWLSTEGDGFEKCDLDDSGVIDTGDLVLFLENWLSR